MIWKGFYISSRLQQRVREKEEVANEAIYFTWQYISFVSSIGFNFISSSFLFHLGFKTLRAKYSRRSPPSMTKSDTCIDVPLLITITHL